MKCYTKYINTDGRQRLKNYYRIKDQNKKFKESMIKNIKEYLTYIYTRKRMIAPLTNVSLQDLLLMPGTWPWHQNTISCLR
jgi:hypothetical protein